MNYKEIIGVIAAGLVLIGYIPYIRDVIKGTTRPHLYSWFLWGFVTSIAFALQVTHGAGAGSLVTLIAALMCIVVLILGAKRGSKKDIKKTDTVFLLVALIAVGFWLIAKQPVISIILVTTIDVLAFAPTVRKSWIDPYSETLSFYWINTFRFGLAIFALQSFSIITALYPISWCLINGLFALFLIMRRKQNLNLS